MHRTKQLSLVLACAVVATAVGCGTKSGPTTPPTTTKAGAQPMSNLDNIHSGAAFRHVMNVVNGFTDTGRKPGASEARGQVWFTTTLSTAAAGNLPGFPTGVTITTNGRSCATCHVPVDNFSLTPANANARKPGDPLVAPGPILADAGGISPVPGVTLLRMIRRFGLIHVEEPNPNFGLLPGAPPAISVFRAVPAVASAAFALSEQVNFQNTPDAINFFTMWDGREPSLENQAADATAGHAQAQVVGGGNLQALLDNGVGPARFTPISITADIAAFQRGVGLHGTGVNGDTNLNNAIDPAVDLSPADPRITPHTTNITPSVPLAPQEAQILVHTPEAVAQALNGPVNDATYAALLAQYVPQSTVAMGSRAFRGWKAYVGDPGKPGCIVCHNMPGTLQGGSVRFEDVRVSEENKNRLPEVRYPLLANGIPSALVIVNADGSVDTPDPGLAGRTGNLGDVNKFKVPGLLNIKNMKRFFHDNHERSVGNMINHYRGAFPNLLKLNHGQARDLEEFLKTL
jgi:cytochrome c peroxidase